MNLTGRLLLVSLSLLLGAGCSKNNDPAAPSTREYQVEYQVSATGAGQASVVAYADQAGNLTQLTAVTLPATYSFRRTLARGAGVNIVASVAGPAQATTITATILLDGKPVQTQTGSSPGGGTVAPSATANVAYVIP